MRSRKGAGGRDGRPRSWRAVLVAAASVGLVAIMIAGVIFSVVASGSGSTPPSASMAADGLPGYAYNSPVTLAAYQSAVANPDLFSEMPCYCGCGVQPDPHENLKDCFLEGDGGFDPHAAGCQTCVSIATDVTLLNNQGLSAKQVRQDIEAKYSGYGPSTDTPPITDS